MLVGGFAEHVEPPGVRSGEDVIANRVEFGAGPAAGDDTKPVGQLGAQSSLDGAGITGGDDQDGLIVAGPKYHRGDRRADIA
jgi:hypothetical protein